LAFLGETQKCSLDHINRLDIFSAGRYMELDHATRRGLELCGSLRTGEKRGSLLWALDKTKTPPGSRLLRSWVERPLLSPIAIKRRLDSVGELVSDSVLRSELILLLRKIGDIRRITSRCVYGAANGKDLYALGGYFSVVPKISALLNGGSYGNDGGVDGGDSGNNNNGAGNSPVTSHMLREIAAADPLGDLTRLITDTICDAPPFSVREGGIIRDGRDAEIDRLRQVRDNGGKTLAELEAREREKTGIKRLKVGYTRVFGYYIDIPRSLGDVTLPDTYIRKQTTSATERYFTAELKALEDELISAKDKICELEYNLFKQTMEQVAAAVGRIQRTADRVAELDALCSLAEAAERNGYTMPQIDVSGEIRIAEGRHPVVELTKTDTLFVPNDTTLNSSDSRTLIITGPNMAGKSTFLRQTALITLMAQIGSFVPAKSATIGIVDRVFTRIGASDDLAAGQSTFMVEMTEVANILRHATKNSLVILDEVGRGTSTYDGMAVARAVLEHCADKKKLGAKTMFATHYHELAVLEGEVPGVKNYSISAKKQGGELIFLRKIVPGAADDSFGIDVAKLAGVPNSVVKSAEGYLRELEGDLSLLTLAANKSSPGGAGESQLSLADIGTQKILSKLRKTDPNTLTPLEALGLVFELVKSL